MKNRWLRSVLWRLAAVIVGVAGYNAIVVNGAYQVVRVDTDHNEIEVRQALQLNTGTGQWSYANRTDTMVVPADEMLEVNDKKISWRMVPPGTLMMIFGRYSWDLKIHPRVIGPTLAHP